MLINNEKFVLFSFTGFLLIALSFKGIDKFVIPENTAENYTDTIIPDSSNNVTPVVIDPLSYDTSDLYTRCWLSNSTVTYSSENKKGYTDSTYITLLDSDTAWAFPVNDRIVSKFGYRGRHRLHKGIDIHLRTGQKVHAAFSGKIRYARYNSGGYGYLVIIRHYNGTETYYAHLSKLLVSSNQEVKAGDVIGLGGNTGASYGPHLHFEIRLEDKAINPEKIFNLNKQCLVVNKLVLKDEIFSGRGKVSAISSRTTFENADKEGIIRHCDHQHDLINEDLAQNNTIKSSPKPIKAKKTVASIKSSPKPIKAKKTVASIKSSPKPIKAKKPVASVKASKKTLSNSSSSDNSSKKYHYIKKGDCVYSLARTYGVSVNSIYRNNNLSSKSILRVNQKVRIK